jgi:hypothetical protein
MEQLLLPALCKTTVYDVNRFFGRKFGLFPMPLTTHNKLHYVFLIGKDRNFIIFNYFPDNINTDISLLPLTEIKLWNIESSKGIDWMKGAAWSSDCSWFFFFTPEEELYFCNWNTKYALCVNFNYFIPFVDMFVHGELTKVFSMMIQNVKGRDVQLGLF